MESTFNPILHVEDNENDVVLVQRALGAASISHPLQIVRNGARAIDYLLGQTPFERREFYPLPCLILLDLDMPLVNGMEFLKWRQNHPVFQRIPVIVLTLSQRPADVAAAYEAGANSYLAKPLTFEELVDIAKAINLYWLGHNSFATRSSGESAACSLPGSLVRSGIPAAVSF
jgi:CheY-like chemotaxis protein